MTAKREPAMTTEARRERPKVLVYERPICPKCGIAMNVGSSGKKGSRKRYFYCPTEHCKESQPMAKPKSGEA